MTHKLHTIGACSCNPSIGGVGKGILVKEIDALDGLMGKVTDKSGIFYRTLNRSRGPAVHGPRAQIDRELYLEHMQNEIFNTPNLQVKEGGIEDLIIEDEAVEAVVLESGEIISTRHVVITTGTFLRAILHFGPYKQEAGGKYYEKHLDISYISILSYFIVCFYVLFYVRFSKKKQNFKDLASCL